MINRQIKEINCCVLRSLQVQIFGVVIAIAATASYCSGQTIRLPYHQFEPREPSAGGAGVITPSQGTRKDTCWLFPLAGDTCAGTGSERLQNINKFYDTAGAFSYFNQIKSVYNGASGSATVSTDIASLNFSNATQVSLGTNVQAGSSGAASTSTGPIPNLSATGAAQATQNMLYNGTFVVSVLYPVISIAAANINSKAGNFGAVAFLSAQGGVDIQNFKSGTNVNVNSPPTHSTTGMQGYIQYNSINTKDKTEDSSVPFLGALFIGGSYGYSTMSHAYARDYGFGNNVGNRLAQISFGILVNDVARVTLSRAFGPSQTYIDGTSNIQKTIDNFKAWSFGINYQQKSKS